MADVFLVTHGQYSDYTVDGVFSTRDLALAWARWNFGPRSWDTTPGEDGGEPEIPEGASSWDDGFAIEVYAMDELRVQPTGCYVARRRVEKRETGWRASDKDSEWVANWVPAAIERPVELKQCRYHPGALAVYSVVGTGPTPEHARRSADEMVRAIVAGTFIPVEDEPA